MVVSRDRPNRIQMGQTITENLCEYTSLLCVSGPRFGCINPSTLSFSLSLSLSVWHAIFRPHDAERRPQLDKGRPLSESRRSPRQRTCLRTQAHLTTGTLASRSMARFDWIRDQPPRHGASLENHRRDVLCCACSMPATLGLQRCRPEASRQAGRQAEPLSLCLSVSLRFFGQSGCPQLVQLGLTSCCSARPRYSG